MGNVTAGRETEEIILWVVSLETVLFFNYQCPFELIICTKPLLVCNFVVPLRPQINKKRTNEKKLVNRHSAADGFNFNFCGRIPCKHQSEYPDFAALVLLMEENSLD